MQVRRFLGTGQQHCKAAMEAGQNSSTRRQCKTAVQETSTRQQCIQRLYCFRGLGTYHEDPHDKGMHHQCCCPHTKEPRHLDKQKEGQRERAMSNELPLQSFLSPSSSSEKDGTPPGNSIDKRKESQGDKCNGLPLLSAHQGAGTETQT